MSKAFGERIRELRTARDMSLRDLAGLIDIDFTYLSKLELGKSNYSPSPWLIRQLALNLGADEDELTNLAGKVPRGLQKMMRGNPLLTELVRVLSEKRLPDEIYQQLLDIARKVQECQD